MRIGELAGLVGISTRAIRHYHDVGLLAGDAGRDVTEILRELDADLARQEADLRQRRASRR